MNRPDVKKTGSQKARNSAARLMAVQTVYQMHKNDQDAESAIAEFINHRFGIDADGDDMVTPDEDHFALVVRGVAEHGGQLEDMILQNRSKKEAPVIEVVAKEEGDTEAETVIKAEEAPIVVQKTEALLQAILLCGTFELMVLQSIDSPIIIADYLNVTHAFYEKGEAKLVNAMLDSIQKTVRS